MLKIGVLGVGHLGNIHLKCIKQLPQYELVGFYDPNQAQATKIAKETGLRAFSSTAELIAEVDVVDIVAPTSEHFSLAKEAILAGKHVFIEKPIVQTMEEAALLIELQKKNPVKVQVGHVERFNPAYLALENVPMNPMFIEAHRLATFNPRGTDVSVVLDLMIHDLDIILSLVPSKVTKISASGVAIVSSSPDIANARIEFENGCVANVTASRMSLKQMRKLRFFQKDAYISMDFLDKKTEIVRLYDDVNNVPAGIHGLELDTQQGKKWLHMSQPDIVPVNAIKMELETFADSIVKDASTRVSLHDGIRALDIAHQIIKEIENVKW